MTNSSSTSSEYTPDAATSTVFATLSFVMMVGSAVIVAFEYLRSNNNDIYVPRMRAQGHRTLKPPPPGPFQWVRHVIKVSDDDFFQSVGLDGFVLLRFLRLCSKVSIVCAVLGLLILAPIYSSCPGNDGVAGINLYTMANLEQDGMMLWAPFGMTWIFTLLLLYMLHKEYEAFAHHRQSFMEHGDPDLLKPQTSYSVLVENVPADYRSSERLTELFNDLFPGEVAHACISVAMQPLSDVVEKRNAAVAEAEIAVAAREASDTKERPMLRTYKGIPVHSVCTCGDVTEVDAIDYYLTEIAALDEKVGEYQEQARWAESAAAGRAAEPAPRVSGAAEEVGNPLRDEALASTDSKGKKKIAAEMLKDLNFLAAKESITKDDVAGTGFVTFKSRRAQVTACQVAIVSRKYPELKVLPAPEPSDIVWPNIATKIEYTKETSGLTKIMYYLGIGFWGLVLAFIATISNLETLDDYLPFISDIDPVLYAVIAGVLPVLMLALFMSYLPIIMEWVSHYVEKRKTRSAITMEVFNWYFLYQITNVYLLMLAGSVATAISDLIDDPSSILSTLGAALPAISVFFINFSLNVLFVEIPVDMLRIAPLALIKFYRYFFDEKALTARQIIEGPLAKEALDYGQELPKLLYFLVLCITYWTIAPILIGVLALIFVVSAITWKYKMLYVYVPDYESGGMYWYGLYRYSMYALVASNLTMIGYMGLKEGPTQSSGLVPLLYVTYRAWCYTEDCFKDVSLNFAYSTAVDADCSRYSSAQKLAPLLDVFHEDYYKQPYYSAPKHATLQTYRIDNIPLFTRSGAFSSVYYSNIPEVERNGLAEEEDEETGLLGGGSSHHKYQESVGPIANEDLTRPLTGRLENNSSSM